MKEIEINKFADFHDAIFNVQSITSNWIFRGHRDSTWKLKPEIGRKPFCDFFELDEIPSFDKNLFDNWLLKAKPHLSQAGNLSDIKLLCIARHNGLPTRILDWTFNPLVAAFFAVRIPVDGDSIVYCLNSTIFKLIDAKQDPFTIEQIHIYDPGSIHQRITNQSSAFTLHNDPRIDMTNQINADENIIKFIIKADYKKTLLKELSYYNIHDFKIFPDLEGLSKRLRWQIENRIEEAKRLGYIKP